MGAGNEFGKNRGADLPLVRGKPNQTPYDFNEEIGAGEGRASHGTG